MSLTKPMRVYIETTVWNFPFADDAPDHREATLTFFNLVRQGRFEAYLSNVVLFEFQAAEEPRRSQLLDLVRDISPILLPAIDAIEDLADEYMKNGLVPERYHDDARHIAAAVVGNMDLLVSWNFKHIVKPKTRRLVAATSRLVGYREIEICTPEEVLNEFE